MKNEKKTKKTIEEKISTDSSLSLNLQLKINFEIGEYEIRWITLDFINWFDMPDFDKSRFDVRKYVKRK